MKILRRAPTSFVLATLTCTIQLGGEMSSHDVETVLDQTIQPSEAVAFELLREKMF